MLAFARSLPQRDNAPTRLRGSIWPAQITAALHTPNPKYFRQPRQHEGEGVTFTSVCARQSSPHNLGHLGTQAVMRKQHYMHLSVSEGTARVVPILGFTAVSNPQIFLKVALRLGACSPK